MGKYQINRLNR